MTLVKNSITGHWEADIRTVGMGRLHVSLRTQKKGEAEDRHAAVKALFQEGNPKVIEALRRRRITVEAVTRVHQSKKRFDSLVDASGWMTLGEATADYLRYLEEQTDRAPKTIQSARLLLGKAQEYFGADRKLDSISHSEVEAWKSSIVARGVSTWSAELELVRLRALYSWIKAREERDAAREKRPAKMLHTPIDAEILQTKPKPKTRWLSNEEAQRLMAACPDSLRFPVAAGLLAGLRLDEVCHLRPPPQDMDFDNAGGVVLVQAKGDWRPKSKKRRVVPIAAELLPIARHHAETYASQSWMVPHPGSPEKPLNKNNLGASFTRIVEDAGLVAGARKPMGVTFHTLRHTFASWLVMSGVDLYTVSQLLGHAGIELVESTYGHLSPDHKRLAIDRLWTAYRLDTESPEILPTTEPA